ncbi:MAG: amino acid permease [Pirellulales bacterium]|nr:amino acid permease [Pirellulales bacterium]
MSHSTQDSQSPQPVVTVAKVVVISSAMFLFISYWRAAALVLCDLASTAYYIGGIVEHSIGPAAPWFIVGVMLFSYAVRSVYIESCSMFVRGGVYRIVKEALGGTLAKIAVSALLFDYILTGPISGVAAGQYVMSLALELFSYATAINVSASTTDVWKSVGSVVIACAVTIFFYRLNVIGIRASSGKALRIMMITAVMTAIVLGWAVITLFLEGPRNEIVFQPDFAPKLDALTGKMESPLGFLDGTRLGKSLYNLNGWNWLSAVGMVGFFLALGHSVLAMSGEETLAQIYREVESPKLPNFRRAAFIVFLFSLLLTGGVSVLSVLLIPNDVRISQYGDNLIGGLAMSMCGPLFARLLLNAFVVLVGALILSGAVNTAIVGSNGVLSRVAEDGVIPQWFLRPHHHYGTNHRLLSTIMGLQIFTIVASRGNVILLGEAYAFGVVWSFTFNALAMLILRFKEAERPRGFRVPLNIRVKGVELPIGLALIFLILLASAAMNVLTKPTATMAGSSFAVALFLLFVGTEYFHHRRSGYEEHEHLDEFNEKVTSELTPALLELTKPYRKLVAIRSPSHLDMLEKALAETDPDTTDVVVMTAHVRPVGGVHSEPVALSPREKKLMTVLLQRAESAGKKIIPIVVSTNNALHAILETARAIGAQELVVGVSNQFRPSEQLDQISLYWISLYLGEPAPLAVRIIGRQRDFNLDLAGGNRIPTIAERRARSIDELRAAGIGVDRVLLIHDGEPRSDDLYQSLLTMLDPDVRLDIMQTVFSEGSNHNVNEILSRAKQVGRQSVLIKPPSESLQGIIQTINNGQYDAVVSRVDLADLQHSQSHKYDWVAEILRLSNCQVFLSVESDTLDTVDEINTSSVQ